MVKGSQLLPRKKNSPRSRRIKFGWLLHPRWRIRMVVPEGWRGERQSKGMVKIGRIMHVHSSALLRDTKEQNRLMMMSSVTILIVGSKEGKFILLVLYIQEEKLLPSLLLFTMRGVIYCIFAFGLIKCYYNSCSLVCIPTFIWSVLGESFPSYSCLTPPTELTP